MPRFFLASQSPRRKQLLTEAGLSFDIITPETDETYPPNLIAPEIAIHIACQKAEAVRHFLENEDDIIISADTIVSLNNELLGKPSSAGEAKHFLSLLSGKEHLVITGVCLLSQKKIKVFHSQTIVEFYPLTKDQIHHYVEKYQPYDKAGGYAIQEWIGLVGMKKINGCYFNVVGLPVSTLLKELTLFNQGGM